MSGKDEDRHGIGRVQGCEAFEDRGTAGADIIDQKEMSAGLGKFAPDESTGYAGMPIVPVSCVHGFAVAYPTEGMRFYGDACQAAEFPGGEGHGSVAAHENPQGMAGHIDDGIRRIGHSLDLPGEKNCHGFGGGAPAFKLGKPYGLTRAAVILIENFHPPAQFGQGIMPAGGAQSALGHGSAAEAALNGAVAMQKRSAGGAEEVLSGILCAQKAAGRFREEKVQKAIPQISLHW